jgi:molybdopterin-biosynthesis enzyme MoeA-like protein
VIPGFACARHFCVPGFPAMAEPMVRWVLEQHLVGVLPVEFPVERSLRLFGVPESRLVPLLEVMEGRYPDLRISSLPSFQNDGPRIELGVRGEAGRVAVAFEDLQRVLVADRAS